MDDFEQQLRNSLRTAAATRPPIHPIEPGEVTGATRPSRTPRRRWTRWVPLAAALALVAGIGVAVYASRPGTVPAVPAGTPSAAPTPTASGATASLVGTRWNVRTINGAPVIAGHSGAVPFLVFETDTAATAGDPCNGMSSSDPLEGGILRFAGWSATEMACGSHVVVVQQGTYLAALGSIETFSAANGELELRDAAGTVRLVLDPADQPTPTEPPTAHGTGPSPTPSPTSRDIRLRLSNQSPWDFASTGINDQKLGALPARMITGYVDYTDDPFEMAVHLAGAHGTWGLGVTMPDVGTLPPGDYTLTIRDIGGRPNVFISGGDRARIFAPDPGDPENQVHDYPQVRLRNDAGSALEYVSVRWSDGGTFALADLQPGEYTGYAEMGTVRLGAEVTVVVDGKRLTFTPKTAGAKLTRGNATYVVRVVDGALDVTTEVQQ
jgi:heat shock protein HslJ